MSRIQALFFACSGVFLLLCISFSISLRNLWLTLLFAVTAILFIGLGFIVKAKARKKKEDRH